MMGGTFALLERSLRVDSRSRASHLIRFGLMAGIYVGLCNAVMTRNIFSAPGLRFFSSITYLDLAFLTLAGIGLFATTITEEKEEDTLGLMLMAGISPLGILTGKSLGGLWQTILLIAVQFPFILLSVTMGGVTQQQVGAVTVALTAYVILLAGMGVLCSTIAAHGRAAVRMMCLMIGAYIVIPLIAKSLLEDRLRQSISSGTLMAELDLWSTCLKYTSELCIFTQIDHILTTSFDESAFSFQVISNLIAGLICGGLSWLSFGRSTRHPSSESVTRELVSRRTSYSPFSTDRVWNNCFAWKDFHFVSGGVGMLLVRIVCFGGLGLIPFLSEVLGNKNGEWMFMSIMFMMFGASLAAANVLARSMYDEIRGQTLSSLMMLPTTPATVVYSKFAGALLGWAPILVCGPMALMTSHFFRKMLNEIMKEVSRSSNADSFILVTLGILLYGMFFVLVPHLAAYLATYVRWGAVPLAFGIAMGVYIAGGTCLSLIVFTFSPPGSPSMFTVVLFLCDLGLVLLCVACHVNILLRVQTLAAK